jgi:hypothetical protein
MRDVQDGADAGSGPSSASNADDLPTIPLDLRRRLPSPVALDRATAAFEDPSWLGEWVPKPSTAGVGRVRTELAYAAPTGQTVAKDALVDVGPAVRDPDSLRVGIAWRSATFAPLFPVFAGELIVESEALALHGRYAPPFGRVGLVIDRALLHVVARGTADAFLTRIAARLVDGRDRRSDAE